MTSSDVWGSALAAALTCRPSDTPQAGAPPIDPGPCPPDVVTATLARLADAGWDTAALRDLAARRQQAGEPWPLPGTQGMPAAQFFALLRESVSTVIPAPTRVRADRPPNAAERRLSADVPPHHGPI